MTALIVFGLASLAVYGGMEVWRALRHGVIPSRGLSLIHRDRDPAVFDYLVFRLGAGAVVCGLGATGVVWGFLVLRPSTERRLTAHLRRQAELKAMDRAGGNVARPFPHEPVRPPGDLG